MAAYKALGLDLDDTLHNYRGAASRALDAIFHYVFDEYGVDPADQKLAYNEILAEHVATGFASGRTSGELRRERFDRLLQTFSIFSGHDVDEMLDIYQRELDGSMQLNEGALELLQAAKMQGLKTIVVTEGPEDAQRHALKVLGIDHLVDHLITSGRHRVSKKDGLIRKILEVVDCAPDLILYVGDSYERDVEPARTYGMAACWYIASKLRQDTKNHLHSFFNLSSIIPILRHGLTAQRAA